MEDPCNDTYWWCAIIALRWENSRSVHAASEAARYPEVNLIFAHCGDVGW